MSGHDTGRHNEKDFDGVRHALLQTFTYLYAAVLYASNHAVCGTWIFSIDSRPVTTDDDNQKCFSRRIQKESRDSLIVIESPRSCMRNSEQLGVRTLLEELSEGESRVRFACTDVIKTVRARDAPYNPPGLVPCCCFDEPGSVTVRNL